MIDSESARGSVKGAGDGGSERRVALGMLSASIADADGILCNWGASKLSGGDSTCCVVLLKWRARHGRRNAGGSADKGIRVSSMDRLIDLLNIAKLRKPC